MKRCFCHFLHASYVKKYEYNKIKRRLHLSLPLDMRFAATGRAVNEMTASWRYGHN